MGVFERQTLPNGLRLLTAPMGHAQSVSCFVMLAAGSRYETPDTSGIAHFAEHMFFKGTERRPTARDIATEIEAGKHLMFHAAWLAQNGLQRGGIPDEMRPHSH